MNWVILKSISQKEFLNFICYLIIIKLGGLCSFYLTGLISSSYLGWRHSFYIFSLTAFIWSIPYFYLVYSEPDDDPNLSDFERQLIKKDKMIEYSKEDFSKNLIKIPPKLEWKTILTSKVVIASW